MLWILNWIQLNKIKETNGSECVCFFVDSQWRFLIFLILFKLLFVELSGFWFRLDYAWAILIHSAV